MVEHLSGFVQDFGVPCSKGTTSFTAILDMPGEMLNLAGVNIVNTAYVLTALATDVAALAIATGDTLTVAGVAYTVRDVMPVDDGAFTHITLSL